MTLNMIIWGEATQEHRDQYIKNIKENYRAEHDHLMTYIQEQLNKQGESNE